MSERERMLFENQYLKAQMEAAIQQVSNQNDKLMMLDGENDGLKSQVLKLSTLMHETDETIKDMKIESGLLKEDISKLHKTINDLNHQLEVKEGQNYAMALDYSESRKLVEQAEERITTLSAEAEMLKNENSMFLSGLENVKLGLESTNRELSNYKHSSEAADSKMNSLREENTQLLSWHDNLVLELERNNQELSKITQALEATEYERNLLTEQKTSLLSKIDDEGAVIDGLKAQMEEAGSEKFQLQLKINDLELESQSVNFYYSDVKNALMAAEEEKKALTLENSVVKSKLQEAESTEETLQNKLEDLNQKNSLLLSKIEGAEKDRIVESGHLKKDISKLQDKITDLNHQLKVNSDENSAMALEFSESKRLIQQAEEKFMVLSVEAERVKIENSTLLAGHENLMLELEGNNKKLSKHKQDLTATESEINSLREENSLLLSAHENMKVKLESNNREISKLKETLGATEFERNSLIEEKSAILSKTYEDGLVIDGLKSQIQEVEIEKSNLQLKSRDLNLKIQSANLQFTDLKNALAVAEEEKKGLVSKKLISESKLQEAEFIEKRLQSEVAGLSEKYSILLSKLEEAEKNISIESRCMKENISNLHYTVTELNRQLKVKDDENYAMALDSSESKKVIKQSEERLMILSVEAEKLINEKFMLLTERENLKLVLQNNNQELSKHKQTLDAMAFEINSMKQENSLLLSGLASLKLDLDDNKQELSKLKQALEATEFERNSLFEENSSLLTKVNEVVTAIDNLKAHTEEVDSEKCQLQQKIRYLEIEIKSADLQFTNVTNALVAAEEEKKALVSKILQVERKLHEANFMEERLRSELEELNQKNSILLSKIEDVEKETNNLEFERDGLISNNAQLEIKVNKLITALDAAIIQLNHLGKLIFSLDDEKTMLKSEISVFTGKLLLAEAVNEKLERDKNLLREDKTAFQLNQGLQSNMVDVCKNLEVTLNEIQDLKDNKLELAQEEALHEIQTWSDTFKGDLLEMVARKGDLDQERKERAEISSENLLSLKRMEDILRSKISDQDTLHKKYEQLLTKHKQLEDCYYESCAKLDTAEKKFQQIEMKEEIIQRLERICAEQKGDINKLVENHRELLEKLSSTKVGKVDAEKEIHRLEVQLRLSNQKLKITETECKEKEENCKMLVAESQEEHRLLNRYVLIWSRISTELNNEFRKMKLALEAQMGTLVNALHEVELISQENLVLIKKQLAECLVELQNLKTSLKLVLHEKKKLENENHDLTVGLTYKEGIILKLKDEASQNLARLAEKDKELRILESRVADSEKNLKEKERLVLDKDEEKREAIRQLCLVIEYHWNNHNYLVSYLSSLLRNRGTS